MKYNKQSILSQIEIVESNLRRLKTLVECDMIEGFDLGVPVYCCMMAINQTENIKNELMGNPVQELENKEEKKYNLKIKKAK